MAAERVSIGFSGGQVVEVRITDATLKAFRKEIASTEKLSSEAGRWYDLETEDGAVALDLRQVVFVRTAAPGQQVGFTG